MSPSRAARRPDAIVAPKHPVPQVHRVAAHLARRFHQICLGLYSEVCEPAGLTPMEYGVVAALEEAPGLDQQRLAARLGVDKVTVGKLVDALERQNLLLRQVDADDRRARKLHLTKRGAALRRKLRPAMVAAQQRVLAPLAPTDQAKFLGMLQTVVEGNETYAKPGNGRRPPRRRAPASPPA
jgi:MarR family transcriptional regulator, temperature-dependent positive regulator of motility